MRWLVELFWRLYFRYYNRIMEALDPGPEDED